MSSRRAGSNATPDTAAPGTSLAPPSSARLPALAAEVGLTPELLGRRPHEVSDGQLQRACVARALALEPRYLVCDEMTTMLDTSTQAHLVSTVERCRARTGAGVLAISHDRTLLDRWCDKVLALPQPAVTRLLRADRRWPHRPVTSSPPPHLHTR